ncbi:MAG: lysophospholipase [Peptococcaceae bacterium]|jgi:acyl-CoA thioesterase-1|nr:lysophospholipase [Peptococcaceae bacterium]
MKVIALGDSITQGFPFSTKESWVYYAAQELDLDIINQGICGDLTRDMLRRFQQDVVAYNATHVIILGGTNDAALGYPLAEVSTNFTVMVDMACRHDIIPILGLPIPFLVREEEVKLMSYRKWLQDNANRKRIWIVDFYAPFRAAIEAGTGMKLYADEVHPSVEGYQLMGKVAVENLRELIS